MLSTRAFQALSAGWNPVCRSLFRWQRSLCNALQRRLARSVTSTELQILQLTSIGQSVNIQYGSVVELAYTLALEASAVRRAGANPVRPTRSRSVGYWLSTSFGNWNKSVRFRPLRPFSNNLSRLDRK